MFGVASPMNGSPGASMGSTAAEGPSGRCTAPDDSRSVVEVAARSSPPVELEHAVAPTLSTLAHTIAVAWNLDIAVS
jgi:hypothetical protein